MLRLTMITLSIGAFANGLLGAVAIKTGVQPHDQGGWDIPVRRQRPKDDPPAPGKNVDEQIVTHSNELDEESADQNNDAVGESVEESLDQGNEVVGQSSEAGEDERDDRAKAPAPAPPAWSYQWASAGVDTVCRLDANDQTVNGGGSTNVLTLPSTDACKAHCAAQASCTGIEYKASTGRCEIWTLNIGFTKSIPSYECIRKTAKPYMEPYTCDTSRNFIKNMDYNQIALTDYCPNCDGNPKYGAPMTLDRALTYCKRQCDDRALTLDVGCTGFFFQKHGNGHEICGFYSTAIQVHQFYTPATQKPYGALCSKN